MSGSTQPHSADSSSSSVSSNHASTNSNDSDSRRSSASSSGSTSISHDVNSPVLFCDKCKQILTNGCLAEGKHRNHKYSKLREVVQKRIDDLESNLKHVRSRSNTSENVQQQVSKAKIRCENMYQDIKEVMTGQYRELQSLLERNQQQAFLILEAERESQEQGLAQLAEDYQKTFGEIPRNIQESEKKQESDDLLALLDETEAQLISLKTMNQFYSKVERSLKVDGMRMRALEMSITKIVQNSKTVLPQPWEFSETITFDEDKKHKDLCISEDKTQISLQGSSTRYSKDLTSANILASQSFTGGQHYWEVDVRACQNWTVGVVESDWVTNGVEQPLGRDKRSWVLESDYGHLSALHHNDVSLVSEAVVKRLGVFVDCDRVKGSVKFCDAATGMQLHVFHTRFRSAIFPAFSIANVGHRQSSKLVICKVN